MTRGPAVKRDRDGDALEPQRYAEERGEAKRAADVAFAARFRAWFEALSKEARYALRTRIMNASRRASASGRHATKRAARASAGNQDAPKGKASHE